MVTSPAVEIPAEPVKLTAPSEIISPSAAIVKAPLSAFKVTIPLFVVVILSLTVIALFLIFTPKISVVCIAPSTRPVKSPVFKIVVPLPRVCTKLAARTPLVVTSFALLIVIAPSGVVLPTNPVNSTSPVVPAVIPSVAGLPTPSSSRVDRKVRFPPPVASVVFSVSVVTPKSIA